MNITPSERDSRTYANWDADLTYRLNRLMSLRGVRPFFAAISWLGNGKLWYTLILMLPLFAAADGLQAARQMAMVGLVNLLIYKFVKSFAQRPRPFRACEEILAGTVALDEYSFPSGHTMHAVGFTIVAAAWFPHLAGLLLTFTVLVALSRVILGLHYPTDVALGAALGFAVARLSFLIAG